MVFLITTQPFATASGVRLWVKLETCKRKHFAVSSFNLQAFHHFFSLKTERVCNQIIVKTVFISITLVEAAV